MNILLIHNILWSYYKADVFKELYDICLSETVNLRIIQIALTEKGRTKFGSAFQTEHRYPYKVLFNTTYENANKWKCVLLLWKEIQTFRPDICILPGYGSFVYLALLLYCKCVNVKSILSVDSFHDSEPVINRFLKRRILSLTELIYCYGRKQANYLLDLGIPESKIHIRTQAVSPEHFTMLNRDTRIANDNINACHFLFVGRLEKVKNIYCLLRAWEKIDHNDSKLKIVGDGSLKRDIINYIESREMTNIEMYGGLKRAEVFKMYQKSTVLILPSLYEAWGVVVNEAMSFGLAVIVSEKCGCVNSLVSEGINGFSFNPHRSDELAEYIAKFLRKDVNVYAMGSKSQEIISAFTPRLAAEQMYLGIQKIMGQI